MQEKLNFGVAIDKTIIEDNITNLVAASIADALGDKETLVINAVKSIICSYVDRDGKFCKKDSWNATPYLKYLAEKAVVDAAREAMNKAVEENKSAFIDAIKKEISKKKSIDAIAQSFISAMLGATQSTWKMPVTVSFAVDKND